MKRWNGWGDESKSYPLSPSAAEFLSRQVGVGKRIPDAQLDGVLEVLPSSSLPKHQLVKTNPLDRLLHARGQSLPDWIALRSGRIGASPGGVAYPSDEGDIRDLFEYAHRTDTKLIPYGGGTSVVGHINPRMDQPCLTVDLSNMRRLLHLDETSRLATFQAGASGPQIEAELRKHGFTLGHYPQSFEYSTLGGWIATRSSGQQSHYYGRIEDLFAGGQVETPHGKIEFLPHAASAAGPDLRQVILGSEGRLGIITQAVVRIRPLPAQERFYGIFFHNWETGVAAVRQIAQSGLPVSMARLSDAQETRTTLVLSGKDQLVLWADRGLRALNYADQRCLLILGLTYEQDSLKTARAELTIVKRIVRQHGGLWTGNPIGDLWRKSRFTTPYLRNSLWEAGYALDTLETIFPWENVGAHARTIKNLLSNGLAEQNERVLAFAHLSHIYNTGASIYVTYLYRRTPDPDETLARWQRLKSAASQWIVTHGGSISHQHGVGLDHAAYLPTEKGVEGIRLIDAIRQACDPERLLNPGKLLED